MNVPVAMKLLLEDGTEMSGRAFGAAGSVGGEVNRLICISRNSIGQLVPG